MCKLLRQAPIPYPLVAFAAYLAFSLQVGFTGSKNLAALLCLAIVLYSIARQRLPREYITSALWLFPSFFILSTVYAAAIAPDFGAAVRELKRPYWIDAGLNTLVFSLLLLPYRSTEIAKALLLGIGMGAIGWMTPSIYVLLHDLHDGRPVLVTSSHFMLEEYRYLLLYATLLAALYFARGAWRYLLGLLLAFVVFALFASMARAVWLAALLGMGLFLAVFRCWRSAVLIGAGAVVALALIAGVQRQGDTVRFKISQGDSGNRYGNGATGVAWRIAWAAPVRGYGAGNYYEIYRQRLPQHPEWVFQKPEDPHNFILSHWLRAGLLGLFSLCALLVSMVWMNVRTFVRSSCPWVRVSSFTLLATLFTVYGIAFQFHIGFANWLGWLFAASFALYQAASRMPPPIGSAQSA